MAAAAASAATPAGRVALVTGSNKGIGLQLVKDLAKKDPKLTVLLCSRDAKRGEEGVKAVGLANVKALALDVDTEKSVEAAAAEVKAKYGGVDILINNAGIAWKGDAFDETVARGTIGTNYYGVKRVQHHFFPLLRDHARVVNISSVMGARTLLNLRKGSKPALADQFLAPALTVAQLDALMEQFIGDVKAGTWQANGWPKSAYGISKVGCSMLTRISARDFKGPAKDVLINCCCPGWVRTDMAGPKAELTVEQGAETPIHLATLPVGAKDTGLFWRKKKVDAWVYVPEADD